MRRYIITLMIVALSVGALFRGADVTHNGLLKMAGTIGILLFGVVGTLAITRWQSGQGLKELETALKLLEPDCFITDWAYQRGGRPDYLVVAPAGLVAICVDEAAKPLRAKRAQQMLRTSADRLEQSVRWLRDRLTAAGGDRLDAIGQFLPELPVVPILVLTRREAEPLDRGVRVCNPGELIGIVRSLSEQEVLPEASRIKLTRVLRQS